MTHPMPKVSEWTNRNMPARKHAGTTFSPVHQPWESQCTASQTNRHTTGL